MYKSMYEVLKQYCEQNRWERKNFYGSEVGQCYRKQILGRLNYPQLPLNERLKRVFKAGYIFENMITEALKPYKPKKPKTFYFNGFAIRPDFIVDGILLEIKTVHSNKFHYKIEEDNIDQHYAYQTAIGCKFFGKKEGRLIYLSKDDLCIREFSILLSKYNQKITKAMLKVKHYWRTKTLPPPKPEFKWECGRCWFFKNNTECQKLKTWEVFKCKSK